MAIEDHLPLQLQVMGSISNCFSFSLGYIFRRDHKLNKNRRFDKSFSSGSTSRWHQDQDKLHRVVAWRQVQDDGQQPRRGAAAPAADDEVLVLGLLVQPAAQRGEALLVEREVPPGPLVEVINGTVLPGRVVEDGAPRRHVQGLIDRWRLLKLGS